MAAPPPPQRIKHGTCPFCQRVIALTFHHFTPRKVHRRDHFKKRYDKETLNHGIDICRLCHNGIHDRFDEMSLAKDYNTYEALAQDPALQKHFAWVAKQKRER